MSSSRTTIPITTPTTARCCSWSGAIALTTRVDTWGPPPLANMTRLFLEMSEADIRVRMRDEGRPPLAPLVHPHEISRGGAVMHDDLVTVTCAIVPHPLVPLALAYRFDCPDRSIVISGDTAPGDALVALATGADVLVHETLWVPGAPGAPGTPLRTHIMNSHTAGRRGRPRRRPRRREDARSFAHRPDRHGAARRSTDRRRADDVQREDRGGERSDGVVAEGVTSYRLPASQPPLPVLAGSRKLVTGGPATSRTRSGRRSGCCADCRWYR